MKYDTKLGIFGNIKKLYTEATKTNNNVATNKADAEQGMLNILASDVDAVEDNFNAIVEE